MKLAVHHRERLRKVPKLVDELDDLHATLTTWGDAEHDDAGSHTHITAESLTTTGTATVGGTLTVGGDATITGAITASSLTVTSAGRLTFANPPITPPALTSSQNNYNPAGLSALSTNWLRQSLVGAWTLNGITRSTFPDGTYLIVTNIDTVDILTLGHEAGVAVANNRILCPNNTNLPLRPNETAILLSDAASNRWRVI